MINEKELLIANTSYTKKDFLPNISGNFRFSTKKLLKDGTHNLQMNPTLELYF